MRRMLLSVLLLFILPPAGFSKAVSINQAQKVNLKWSLTAPGSYIDYENQSEMPLIFHIHVKSYFKKNGRSVRPDSVTMFCGNAELKVRPHMEYMCRIDLNQHLRLLVKEKDFRHGAVGKGWYHPR